MTTDTIIKAALEAGLDTFAFSPSLLAGDISNRIFKFAAILSAPLNARIAELESEKAERLKPCVWDGFEKETGYFWNTGCGYRNLGDTASVFCPDCGHPVEVREEK